MNFSVALCSVVIKNLDSGARLQIIRISCRLRADLKVYGMTVKFCDFCAFLRPSICKGKPVLDRVNGAVRLQVTLDQKNFPDRPFGRCGNRCLVEVRNPSAA